LVIENYSQTEMRCGEFLETKNDTQNI